MDRAALAGFLRRRREALQPEDVGLPPGVRRRAPGLRREEVASLALMSTDYYLPVRAVSSSTEGTPAKGYQSDVTTITFQFLPATAANLAQLRPVIPAGFTRTAHPPVNLHG
jgi:hypothetical protein